MLEWLQNFEGFLIYGNSSGLQVMQPSEFSIQTTIKSHYQEFKNGKLKDPLLNCFMHIQYLLFLRLYPLIFQASPLALFP